MGVGEEGSGSREDARAWPSPSDKLGHNLEKQEMPSGSAHFETTLVEQWFLWTFCYT